MTQTANDPDTYETLAKPLKTEKEARERLEQFFDLVTEARKTCGLPEVAIQAAIYVDIDGQTRIARASLAFGNSVFTPALLAFALNNILNGEPE